MRWSSISRGFLFEDRRSIVPVLREKELSLADLPPSRSLSSEGLSIVPTTGREDDRVIFGGLVLS